LYNSFWEIEGPFQRKTPKSGRIYCLRHCSETGISGELPAKTHKKRRFAGFLPEKPQNLQARRVVSSVYYYPDRSYGMRRQDKRIGIFLTSNSAKL
jgi:hypothetical protein